MYKFCHGRTTNHYHPPDALLTLKVTHYPKVTYHPKYYYLIPKGVKIYKEKEGKMLKFKLYKVYKIYVSCQQK